MDLATGTLSGVEALLRWEPPVRGPISPAVFVPLAEATGLIGSIGRWALEQSCRQLADWQRDFPDGYPLTVEVNLAPAQLAAHLSMPQDAVDAGLKELVRRGVVKL